MFDIGKVWKERDLCDTLEVREVFHNELSTVRGKDLDSEFKEIEDAEKVRENGIGGKVIEREIVATLEVTNNTEAKKAIVVEKEAEGKFGDSSEVRESYEADITKMGKRF